MVMGVSSAVVLLEISAISGESFSGVTVKVKESESKRKPSLTVTTITPDPW